MEAQKQQGYKQVQPGLYRCNLGWYLGPLVIPVCTFLIPHASDPKSWIMIDAGFEEHLDALIAAVQSMLGQDGQLTHILITHAHLDHVAALPRLLALYPDCRVGLHSREAAFLVHGKPYSSLKGDTLAFNLFRLVTSETRVRVLEHRIQLLCEGEELGGGVVRAIETPGHTPGSMSYLHTSSGSLMIGDALMRWSVFSPHTKCCSILNASTSSMQEAVRSVWKMVELKPVTQYYPAHDNDEKGADRDALISYLRSR